MCYIDTHEKRTAITLIIQLNCTDHDILLLILISVRSLEMLCMLTSLGANKDFFTVKETSTENASYLQDTTQLTIVHIKVLSQPPSLSTALPNSTTIPPRHRLNSS
jgi:hypothetical protein